MVNSLLGNSHYVILQEGPSQCFVFQSGEPKLSGLVYMSGCRVDQDSQQRLLQRQPSFLLLCPISLFSQAVEKNIESHTQSSVYGQTHARQSGDERGKPTHTIPHQRASLGVIVHDIRDAMNRADIFLEKKTKESSTVCQK